ncbi:MAG: dihydroorotate dehydrogenase [Acidobacteriota bacterium]|jgi:dihydroorotate dehydrogenase (NAD+) catalytic subunit|nr:dihydroorotate dehydrogenase [Acidobacteriota bacterium]
MKKTTVDKATFQSPNLAVEIAGVRFKNPVLTASGTYGYGLEFSPFMDLNSIGGIVVKGLSMIPVPGNPPPRIYETASGMLNAIGWQNIGAREFVTKKLPELRNYNVNVVVNIVGFELDDYLEVARFLNDCPGIHALELNISCPNVKKGGFHFNKDPKDAAYITAATKKAAPNIPLWVKLSPNVTNIHEFARACEDAGADALSVINTLIGMAIDIEKRRPRLRFRTGGLSGPAIKPVALRMVWETCQAVKIPVIGIGGIASTEDALEFLIAGARAVQIGTANFYEPDVSERIARGLAEYCRSHHIEDINELIGSLRDYE